MSLDPFGGLLDPFAFWDIGATYDRYAAFFDLVIYCAIFIALCTTVLTSRFSGRPGRVLAAVFGIALGVSLVVVERKFGFSLRQASPVAALIAVLLLGFLLAQTLVRIHVPWTLAMPLSYVVIYLFLRAVSPAMMETIAARAPFVHLLTVIMFLICLWRAGAALWPAGGFKLWPHSSDAGFVAMLDRGREKNENGLLKNLRRGEIPEAERDSVKAEHTLLSVLRELNRSAPDWTGIGQASVSITQRADESIIIVDRVRTLDRRLENFDLHELAQLNAYYQQLTDQDRNRLKNQVDLERRKIIQEHAIDQLGGNCERRHGEFRQRMEVLARAAAERDRAAALQAVSEARAIEEMQRAEIRRLLQAEGLLQTLTGRKLRDEKHV